MERSTRVEFTLLPNFDEFFLTCIYVYMYNGSRGICIPTLLASRPARVYVQGSAHITLLDLHSVHICTRKCI